jgi:hypothetical protein
MGSGPFYAREREEYKGGGGGAGRGAKSIYYDVIYN